MLNIIVKLPKRLNLWPLTCVVLASEGEIVWGHQVEQVGFLQQIQFLPTGRPLECLSLCQQEKSLISCCKLYFSHCKIKYKSKITIISGTPGVCRHVSATVCDPGIVSRYGDQPWHDSHTIWCCCTEEPDIQEDCHVQHRRYECKVSREMQWPMYRQTQEA